MFNSESNQAHIWRISCKNISHFLGWFSFLTGSSLFSTDGLMFSLTLLLYFISVYSLRFYFWGAGMAQWWERSPLTNVARFQFPDPASYVGWVSCWFSTLLREVLLRRVLRFSPLLKNQHFHIPVRSGMHGHFWTSSSCDSLVLRG